MVSEVLANPKIEKGDFVKLKQEFKSSYPTIPARMALKIEDIQQNEAIVVFINFDENKIFKERVLVSALSNAL
jgi:hypothetical protein